MRRPAGSSSAAALAMAILLGVLVLMALVMDGGEKTGAPAIAAGRRMLVGAADAGQMRTLEDFKADDPFQDSKRRVPNGPDPIHNSCDVSDVLGNRQVRKISGPSVAARIPRHGRFRFKEGRHICGAKRWLHCKEEQNKNNIMMGSGCGCWCN
ncbi:hypothetical protein OsI_13948 [Oryza sativa Indica Group]|uniref:Uncharacterized protein n=2 Tax=Oryza sativa TaxID=4530 RepID=B9F6J3_ORYSJ|nr:hypothetical protein OsI_13948 [Oryza sativa Indica Group]EEE60124.1 hypothetical protein OsJ_13001 [Oryza sativa Japonica Group]